MITWMKKAINFQIANNFFPKIKEDVTTESVYNSPLFVIQIVKRGITFFKN